MKNLDWLVIWILRSWVLFKIDRAITAIFRALHVEPIANAQHVSAWAAPARRLSDQFHSGVQFGKPLGNSSVLLCHECPTPYVFLAGFFDALDESEHAPILFLILNSINPPRPVAGTSP